MTLQPRRAQLRDQAVQVLAAAGTLAGANVIANRVDEVPEGDLPVISVWAHEDRKVSASDGNTGILFLGTGTLTVQGLVLRAVREDCTRDIDLLEQQILDALLQDPVWAAAAKPDGQGSTIEVTQTMQIQGDRLIGAVMIKMPIGPWNESYPAAVSTTLSGADIHTDARVPFDPNGTYGDDADAGFPDAALPAPRASGPDGRIEITATVDLPSS